MSLRRLATSLAFRIPPLRRLIVQRDQLRLEASELRAHLNASETAPAGMPAPRSDILSEYVVGAFGDELAFKIFGDEWSSDIPGFGFGESPLFDDFRIAWIAEQCGGFAGKRILKLGPLEAGHTYMMARGGAARITAVESNTRAFLKCLIVRNALKFVADFRLGDFRTYLASCTESYDLLLASGVLYHMMEPVKLLADAARVAGALAIWTHYYDAEIIRGNPDLATKFDAEPKIEPFGAIEVVSYRQGYGDALHWQGFCGGSAPDSYWLTRESLLGVLGSLGFTVTVGHETAEHVNGPAILLYATR